MPRDVAEYATKIVIGGRDWIPYRLVDSRAQQKCNSDDFVPLAPTFAMGTILVALMLAPGLRHRIAGEQGGEGS
jgi:hypothetical protein